MNLSGNTILITGGGSGIGFGLATAFKELGNEVIVAGRSPSKLEAAKAKGLHTLTVDMMSQKSLHELAQKAIQTFPNLNVVIHNAGIMLNEKLSKGNSHQVVVDTITTNVMGPMLLNNELIPHLLKQKSAVIMTVSSGLAFVPLSMTPTYCASKAAIHSYTESLRFQMRGTSVEVKELIPPYVRTSLMGDRQAQDPNAMPLDAFITEVMSILKKNPQANEIAVQNVLPMRNAAFEGETKYREIYQIRNEGFLRARQQEWDAL